ncbi:MAG: chlorite dismutase family protein [Acidimicrobiales bacterium]
MPEPLSPASGWAVLHLFCRVDAGRTDGQAAAAAVEQARADDHQVVTFAVLGHKADIGFMAAGPDLWRLRALQTALQAAGLAPVDSYLSLTEVSEYAGGVAEPVRNNRIYPKLPPKGKRAICFYPMSKRRQPGQNWYTLPFERRLELMHEHGASGRRFHGRIVQLVTGSTGVDDYEWGVTLFGQHPDDLKAAVYTMRYDEASAVYAEFGPFTTGIIGEVAEVLGQLGVDAG